ncbi:pimeloyl-ACP methyl ester esterase BioH [Candidatus Palibaumannia cicadellinicola]|uniref:Pimeloyl-[acyl-carrier protein] methyl ester esterase n=1 Tax=Baumannia cicadellinicola subsp. Homalodisca coagulata TaxID=374463 RepID=Q1LSZ2_BAUCH|nr:pimeloyl-ACP methyl ester esterase BioH [Candidatus Baumannia cicadellinicola]ABF14295.1 bioH protein [Baumannia cicadellinicola str. Hc (Homalodisca coagulata)]MBS0032761.1 pimeloyl-ACP methyl ester esterase BioH [Candidatus Baumannia cicadellinicola]MCJ7462040.1 pimeloyl-ACP methyl ester esterase BioH [Candidatus Baumannia cicadellinicola]MCJ7463067.1 pimeloyl-ACP methyl ester esterase BioH [Candidatus Baumannia cicadellinicola]
MSRSSKKKLVLLHGWGFTTNVWSCIEPQLSSHFYIYNIELPGYGNLANYANLTVTQMANILVTKIPDKTLLLGWSLGGLVATKIAQLWPEKILGLITVASSPCFSSTAGWPGIKPKFFYDFFNKLNTNIIHTINNFIVLQTMNTNSSYSDTRWLKKQFFSQKIPSIHVLNAGLMLLFKCDLRYVLPTIKLPLLRLYGNLDPLIPEKSIQIIDKLCLSQSNSLSITFYGAAHVPFLSHARIFCRQLFFFSSLIK